jgi:hypothetical protein
MQGTGRSPVMSEDEKAAEAQMRQRAKDMKRDTRRTFMKVVAHATDVLVKRAPLTKKGQLPHTRLAYHEKIRSGRRRDH